MLTDSHTLRVALVTDVFFDNDASARLRVRLSEAKNAGAELAVLPELPCNPWSPATQSPRDSDAEPPNGPRATMQADAARDIGIGLIGGAIVRDPATGVRRNTALIIDAAGNLLATYAKTHLPQEPGFWETSHYEPGDAPSPIIDTFGLPFGVQICSDINRPTGTLLIGAAGGEAVLAPRATEHVTYERWRPVFIASALTAGVYMVSVNRPAVDGGEQGVLIGGPSIAVDPRGRVLIETTDPVAVVTLDRTVVADARRLYPGYLAVRSDLYAEAWSRLAPTALPSVAQSADAFATLAGNAVPD